MGPIKTYGPTVLAAIEQNDINKVTDIVTNKFRDKQKTKQFLLSEVRRLQSESVAVPLLAAATLDDPSILRFLVNEHEADINFVYECGTEKHRKCQMAVLTAVKRSCYAMVDVIVSLGGDVNAQDHKGRTPLHHAVHKANRRMVRMLLSRGAKSDICDADGQLPLDIATMYGHQELVRLLMSYGGNLCRPGGSTGSTPVHGAAREGHAHLLQMFGELYRADGNFMAQCEDGISRTPLHVAATEGNPGSVKALLEFCSADPNLKDSEGNAAIHCTLANRYDSALGTAPEGDVVDTIQVLISHGADINRSNGMGDTALHMAARNGLSKAVKVLVEAGCDTLLSDNFGHRAIDLLAPTDELSKSIIMAAMAGRTRSRAEMVSEVGPPGAKSKLSHPPKMKSYKSNSAIQSKEPSGTTDPDPAVAKPRPAVRKTKSVENLDQELDNAPKEEKSKAPNPVARAPRIRSNSVQGPEVTDLNCSIISQPAGKKLSVLKQKKEKKLIESQEQPEAELPLTTGRKKVLKLNVSTNETTSLDRTTDSEEYLLNGDAKAYGKMIPPQVPKKTITTKNNSGAHTKKEESQPSLQAWLDEQARLIKERETADQGGPVAQSTPPTMRNNPLSKESMETSTNDSDSDANMLAERRAKQKPPPPPKPTTAKKLSVSSVVGVTTQKADLPSAVKDRAAASEASQNLKEVQNIILQRRDSQTSLTGIAQLGIGENSLCYEPASPVIDSNPSKANSRLNMSLDSARSNPTGKGNRPVPKSRELRSGTAQRSNLNSVMKQLEHEAAATSESDSLSSDENKVVTTGGKIKQHPMSAIKDSEEVLPLAAQRKQTPVPEQQSSRKPVGLVFEKAAANVLPEKKLGKIHPSRKMDKDFVDRSNEARKSSVANVSRSSETFPKPSDEHKPSSHPVTMKQQSKAAIVHQSESEDEEDSEEESEDSEEEEEDEEEEESEDEDEEMEEENQPSRKVLNTNTTAKPLRSQEVRTVTFYSQDNPGFTIIGGNAEGIFVHSLDPNSEAARNGLSSGDQILYVNGKRVLGRTKEEATQMLQVRGGELSLHVRSIPNQYKVVMDSGGIGDGFFVQAQFNYDAAKKGELNIREGDIFSVTDTLLENSPGVWKAHKISAKKNEEQIGTIPNRQKADQIMVKYRLSNGKSNPDQRGSSFFRSFKRSKSAERNSKNQEEEERNSSTVTSGVVSYQQVMQRLSENRRPVIVLGLFCDIVINMLIHDSPELFETPQEEVETSKSSEEPVNVRLIRGSYNRGKHCLIILTPPSIEYLLQKTDLNPIVIYISPVSKSVVKTVKAKLAPNYNKNAGYMYDEAAKFEKTYGHLFSTSVAYTTDDWWFFHLKEAIGRMQNQPIWRTVTDEEVEASAVTELNKICPGAAVLPPIQGRQSRDKTPRFSRTTDDLPAQVRAQNGAGVRGKPPLAGNREPQNSVEAQEVRKELVARSILKQRPPGESVSSDQGSIKSGIPKNISVSFDEQEPSDMPKYVTGKMPKPRIPTNAMGRETLL